MPVFEFKCENCNKTFETMNYRDGQPVTCAHCGSPAVVKLLSKVQRPIIY